MNEIVEKTLACIKSPNRMIGALAIRGAFNWMGDEAFLKMKYRAACGKRLDLKNPQTFNEKLQWLKLHDRKTEYTKMVDKYEVKKYVADKIGGQYIIPTYGVWDSFDEIDFGKLPDSFVLKCTHDSGGIIICRNKAKLDLKAVRKKLMKSLKRNYYYYGREWVYKGVKPRIIAEKYMESAGNEVPDDYKVHCFNGEPQLIEVDYDRFIAHKCNLYTVEWKYIDAEIGYPANKECFFNKPKPLQEMLYLSEKLSNGIPYLRTDFYVIDERVYFGELTFYPGSGWAKIKPEEFEAELGSRIDV